MLRERMIFSLHHSLSRGGYLPSRVHAIRLMARVDHQVIIARETSMRKPLFTRIVKDESGVTAIEYGLIASLIAVVIIAIVGTVGQDLSNTFNTVAESLA
jgi:pilus assembly protein Flp/PilA